VMTRWQITHGKKVQVDPSPQPIIVDTGKPGPLKDFINWGLQSYPAMNVAFVMWSHGDGIIDWGPENAAEPGKPNPVFVQGKPCASGFSDTFKDYLTTVDLAADLAASDYCKAGHQLAVAIFDCCLMSMVEIGYEIRASASYMVGCEIELMNPGLPYTPILSGLGPNVDAKGFASQIVAAYGATTNPNTNATLAAVDLQQLPAFAIAFQKLVVAMTAEIGPVVTARTNYPSIYYGYFVDIDGFFGKLAQGLAPVSGVLAALQNAVLPNPVIVGPGVGGYGGLALYFPVASALVAYLPTYQALALSKATGWGNLLATLLKAMPQSAKLPGAPVQSPVAGI